jgi:hypothetical protein
VRSCVTSIDGKVQAMSGEFQGPRTETAVLKDVVADLIQESRLLKNGMGGVGRDQECDAQPLANWRAVGRWNNGIWQGEPDLPWPISGPGHPRRPFATMVGRARNSEFRVKATFVG